MARNLIAKVLADPRYRKRVVRNVKGKGSYRRRPKHPGSDSA
jgi:stalled ribosome alternative rescue factor ArfA